MVINGITITFVRHFREMIVITGAAGFIGSCLASSLNQRGREDLILVDDFSKPAKQRNWLGLKYLKKVDRDFYVQNLRDFPSEMIFHMGARTDTMEFNIEVFDRLNLNYSKSIWNYATATKTPLIYASSAATYGDGNRGFSDEVSVFNKLEPLNPYGQSKHEFDRWALAQELQPPFWVGLKFFNVFGPNEYHKGRMASVVYHTFHQIKKTGAMKLFESHHPDFKDGEQTRDFIYIKDVLKVIHFWQDHQRDSGIYNLGTGVSRTFFDLAKAVFKGLNLKTDISFIPTPENLRATYQYYTQAEMARTLSAGYNGDFTRMEDAVIDYVTKYLQPNRIF